MNGMILLTIRQAGALFYTDHFILLFWVWENHSEQEDSNGPIRVTWYNITSKVDNVLTLYIYGKDASWRQCLWKISEVKKLQEEEPIDNQFLFPIFTTPKKENLNLKTRLTIHTFNLRSYPLSTFYIDPFWCLCNRRFLKHCGKKWTISTFAKMFSTPSNN